MTRLTLLWCVVVGVGLLAATGNRTAITRSGHGAAWSGADGISVMTYNAHWAEQTDARTGRWTGEIDLGRIAREIRGAGAEIVFLQELQSYRVGARQLSEAKALARMLGWTRGGVSTHAMFRSTAPLATWCRRNSGRAVVRSLDGRPARCLAHGNALLSKWPLLRGAAINLFRPDGNLLDGDLYGAPEGRNSLRASIFVDGGALWIATLQLGRQPEIAACQLRDLLETLDRVRPLLLGGDFNIETRTEVSRPRCDGVPPRPLDQLARAGLIRGEPAGRTYPAFRPDERIDHLFASVGLALRHVRPQDNCYRRRCSSDHRPLVAEVLRSPSTAPR